MVRSPRQRGQGARIHHQRRHTMNAPPRLLITMGDVAGIGPEIIARAWPRLLELCQPVVVGDLLWLRRAIELVGSKATVRLVEHLAEADPKVEAIPCFAGSDQDLRSVEPGRVSAAAGRAAFDFLCAAIDMTLSGQAAGI